MLKNSREMAREIAQGESYKREEQRGGYPQNYFALTPWPDQASVREKDEGSCMTCVKQMWCCDSM